jgi:fructokinase
MGASRIGVDLGGTKIEVVALAADGGETLRYRVDTPRHDYAATIKAITELVLAAENRLGEAATVGIGTPGAISPASGLLKNSNSTWLNGKPLQRDLEFALQRQLRIANDADCFTLSEASDGSGAGASSVFGVILGTGTGGGLVFDGRLVSGPNAIAGEWGHNPLPWPHADEQPGSACYCGKTGCLETWLSGPALEREYRQLAGRSFTATEVAQRDQAGSDALAIVCLDTYVDRLARGLASVINLLDPEVIVLGGGVGNIDRLYRDVPGRWGRYVFSDSVDTRLLRPLHGDSSGVRGAAWLWRDADS